MAVVLTSRWPGVNADDYERLRREVTSEGSYPASLLVQVAAVDGGDLVLTEVWDSEGEAAEFRRLRLEPASRRIGLPGVPEVSKLEVHRILGPGGRPTARSARRVLVVANQTLGSPGLEAEMRRRSAEGSCVFHLLVPATPGRDLMLSATAAEEAGDLFLQDQLMQRSWEQARRILEEHVEALRRRGLDVTGEVGLADPALAVRSVLGRRRFDEVILSTLPSGISRWLGMDLPTRLRKSVDIPLTVVSSEQQKAS